MCVVGGKITEVPSTSDQLMPAACSLVLMRLMLTMAVRSRQLHGDQVLPQAAKVFIVVVTQVAKRMR
jgi:hypothetical protein